MNDVTLAILVAFAMIYAPRVLAAWAQLTMPGGFNWAYSRDQQAQMKGFPKRAQAAHSQFDRSIYIERRILAAKHGREIRFCRHINKKAFRNAAF